MKKQQTNCIISKVFPTRELLEEVLHIDLDTQKIIRVSTGKECSKFLRNNDDRNRYYAIGCRINGKSHIFSIHRLFFYWKHGYLPKIVDHIDRNSLNNKIENLREITHSGNSTNRKKSKKKTYSSIHKGVCWDKEKEMWISRFRNLYIGEFDNEDEAGQAYNNKIRELGLEEIAVLNDTPQERARKINLFNEKEELAHT